MNQFNIKKQGGGCMQLLYPSSHLRRSALRSKRNSAVLAGILFRCRIYQLRFPGCLRRAASLAYTHVHSRSKYGSSQQESTALRLALRQAFRIRRLPWRNQPPQGLDSCHGCSILLYRSSSRQQPENSTELINVIKKQWTFEACRGSLGGHMYFRSSWHFADNHFIEVCSQGGRGISVVGRQISMEEQYVVLEWLCRI
jgi:hypothetical protein